MKTLFNLTKILVPLAAASWLVWTIFMKVEIQEGPSEDIQEKTQVTKNTLPQLPPSKATPLSQSEVIIAPLNTPQASKNDDGAFYAFDEKKSENVQSQTQVAQELYNLNQNPIERYFDENFESSTMVTPPKKEKRSNPTIGPLFYYPTPAPTPTATLKPSSAPSGEESGQVYISVESDKASGTYALPLEVELVLKINSVPSQGGSIYYCKGSSGACCDPLAITSTYTAPVELGSEGNGVYCLSFYGKTAGGIATQPVDLIVTIDNTIPSLPETAEDYYETQTTERYSFSLPPFTYSGVPSSNMMLSFHLGDDSSLATPNCEEVARDLSPMDFQLDGKPDYFDFVKYLSEPFSVYLFYNFLDLHYGDNYLINMLAKKTLDRTSYNCSAVQVVVKDFEVYSTLPLKSSTSSDGYMLGGFTSQGYFEETATSSSPTGIGRKDELHSDFFNTVF